MEDRTYYLKNKYPEFFPLTDEEVSLGWHFCPEWDFLLVGPGMEQQDSCTCFITINGGSDV